MRKTSRTAVAAALAAALAAATGAEAKPAPKPSDLVVSSIAVVKGKPQAGAALTIRVATKNVGPGRAKPKSRTLLALSKDAKLDFSDLPLGGRRIGKLRAGHTSTGDVPVTLPKTQAAGAYRLFACADAKHKVTEKDEANNCESIALTVVDGPAPGGGNGPLAYLKVTPPTAKLGVGASSKTFTTILTQNYPHAVTYKAEGYDADGHDLGDFTGKAKFEVLLFGDCLGVTCSVSATGSQPVYASVGSVYATAEVTGVAPDVTCRSENYDVDGSPWNGCEAAQASPLQGVAELAKSLGSKPCNDGLSAGTFGGTLLSDARKHDSNPVPGFDPSVGSAPAWWKVHALGPIGLPCVNDLKMTITTSGGSNSSTCYRLSMKVAGDPAVYGPGFYATFTLSIGGNRTDSYSIPSHVYDAGSTVYFEFEKTCDTKVREAVKYDVSYHL
jgi:hypothetical protein